MVTQKLYTLIFITKNRNEMLLGYKTRGIGVGLWNGFGGKVEKDETILEGAIRELKEESNLDANLKHLGVVTYFVKDKSHEDVVHILTATKFNGEIIESEEMSPIKWFAFDDIPFNEMWPDCVKWMPYVLQNQRFIATVTYNHDKIIKLEKQRL